MSATDEITNNFAEIALECGFSILSPKDICSSHYLSETQYSLMCLCCYKQKRFDSLAELLAVLQRHTCKHNQKHLISFDIAKAIKKTQLGELSWGTDCLNIFSSHCESLLDGFARRFSYGKLNLERCSPVYFSSFEGQAFLCCEVIDSFTNRNEGCFIAQIIKENGTAGHIGSGAYIEGTASKMLLHALENRAQQVDSSMASIQSVELYVTHVNAMFDQIVSSYTDTLSQQDALKLNTDLIEEFPATSLHQGDDYFARYLTSHACPVCHRYYTSEETLCPNCKFELGEKSFVNRADAELWRKEIVEPHRKTVPHIDYRPLYALWASRNSSK